MFSMGLACADDLSAEAHPTTSFQSATRRLSKSLSAASSTILAASKGLTVVGTNSTAACGEVFQVIDRGRLAEKGHHKPVDGAKKRITTLERFCKIIAESREGGSTGL